MSDTNMQQDIIDIAPDEIIEGAADDKNKPKAPKSWRGRIALTASLVALSAVGGGWIYRDLLASFLPSDQIQAMAVRVDGLEANAKTLSGKVEALVGFTDEMKSQLTAAQAAVQDVAKLKGDTSVAQAAIGTVQKSMVAMEASLKDLKSQVAAGGNAGAAGDVSVFADRISGLEKDIESLKQLDKTSTDTTLLSQNLSDLKAKIAAGTSYQSEIERVAMLVPAADGLDILQAHSALGLPHAAGLAAELKLMAGALPKPEPEAAADDSWWGYASSLAAGLITIKTAGLEDWEQVALHAAALAAQGDLGSAVASLEKVEGALPVDLQKWHDRATARLDIEAAVEKTSAAVLRQIAAKG